MNLFLFQTKLCYKMSCEIIKYRIARILCAWQKYPKNLVLQMGALEYHLLIEIIIFGI